MSADARERVLGSLLGRHKVLFQEDYAAIDRLILEVQSEMPCYQREFYFPRRVCKKDEAWSDWNCPSCTARMKLKETADAR